MARKRKNGVCAYCGTVAPLTKEHVIPKGLFPKPRPNNLITVPCCEKCNNEKSEDDEYFRIAIIQSKSTAPHPQAQKVMHQVYRSLTKEEKRGFQKLIEKSLIEVDEYSPDGKHYLGKQPAFYADASRINNVASGMIKGLFYHVKGYRLPDTHQAEAKFGFHSVDDEGKRQLGIFISALQSKPKNELGNGVFTYQYHFFEDEDPDSSFWLLTFYEGYLIWGTTRRKP